jgi:hypothetical protein
MIHGVCLPRLCSWQEVMLLSHALGRSIVGAAGATGEWVGATVLLRIWDLVLAKDLPWVLAYVYIDPCLLPHLKQVHCHGQGGTISSASSAWTCGPRLGSMHWQNL